MRISDWSSDVCSSDLWSERLMGAPLSGGIRYSGPSAVLFSLAALPGQQLTGPIAVGVDRSEEHTSELQSLMRISYAVFCLKKKKKTTNHFTNNMLMYLIHIYSRTINHTTT